MDSILYTKQATVPRIDEISVDATVLVFSFAVTIVVALLFGLIPALRMAGTPLVENLRSWLARARIRAIFSSIRGNRQARAGRHAGQVRRRMLYFGISSASQRRYDFLVLGPEFYREVVARGAS